MKALKSKYALLTSVSAGVAACVLTLGALMAIGRGHAAAGKPSDHAMWPNLGSLPVVQTRFVAVGGVDSDGCTDPGNPCRTIQYAVDQAAAGDEIRVAAGRYTDVSIRPRLDVTDTSTVVQVAYITKTVAIRGGYTTTNQFAGPADPIANPTTLDAQGQGRVVYVGGQISPTIQGLRITGGDAQNLGGAASQSRHVGGGIYIITATALLVDNDVYSNTTYHHGGGAYLRSSPSTLRGNVFRNNQSVESAGGIGLTGCDAALVNNTIWDNVGGAYNGGGIAIAGGRPVLIGNRVIGNRVGNHGGGLYVDWYCDGFFANNVFAENSASLGSALFLLRSTLVFEHNTIAGDVEQQGIGVFVDDYAYGNPQWQASLITLTNSIIVGHRVAISVTRGNTVSINGTLWDATTAVTVSVDPGATVDLRNEREGNPGFVNPGARDYHIRLSSAAIDAGTLTNVWDDMDGDPRPQGSAPDLGADEAGLLISKTAHPAVVGPGELLTYTLLLTNTAHETLTAIVLDQLPAQIMPTQRITWWLSAIPPREVWTVSFPVTVSARYQGPITNTAVVETTEGPRGEATVIVQARYAHAAFLPLVMRVCGQSP